MREVQRVHGAWVEFVHRGDAGWPRYDLDARLTMIFDHTSRIEGHPLAFERSAWELGSSCRERAAETSSYQRLATQGDRPRSARGRKSEGGQ